MVTGDFLIVKLDEQLKIVGIDKAKTSGLAHQAALKLTDDGFRCKIINPEDGIDVEYLYNQVIEKRTMGFIEEYGHVPNGTRKPGDGCRTVGNMIYPAFGGMLEGDTQLGDNAGERPGARVSQQPPSSEQGIPPLSLSNKDSEIPLKKIVIHIGE